MIINQKDIKNTQSDSLNVYKTNSSIKAYSITVVSDYVQQRIDNFLLRELKGIPKSHIYRILRRGEVRVNGKRIKPDYKLCLGDSVRIPPIRMSQNLTKEGEISKKVADVLLQRIIYEDDALIVLNKPSGMAAHGGSGINFGVIEAMRKIRPDIRNLELVHRLDRETSGCMLLAKKRSMLRILHRYLRDGEIIKTYVLLVKGKWQGGMKKVAVGLLKNRLSSGERIVKVSDAGKESLTVFQPVRIFREVSLINAHLYTGKTHQIRVHTAHIGHPIAGDDKYGDKEFNKIMNKLGLKRLFLHAAEIKFKMPDSGEEVLFTAPLDEDLVMILKRLGNSPGNDLNAMKTHKMRQF